MARETVLVIHGEIALLPANKELIRAITIFVVEGAASDTFTTTGSTGNDNTANHAVRNRIPIAFREYLALG
jgi:hypothetical protein